MIDQLLFCHRFRGFYKITNHQPPPPKNDFQNWLKYTQLISNSNILRAKMNFIGHIDSHMYNSAILQRTFHTNEYKWIDTFSTWSNHQLIIPNGRFIHFPLLFIARKLVFSPQNRPQKNSLLHQRRDSPHQQFFLNLCQWIGNEKQPYRTTKVRRKASKKKRQKEPLEVFKSHITVLKRCFFFSSWRSVVLLICWRRPILKNPRLFVVLQSEFGGDQPGLLPEIMLEVTRIHPRWFPLES